MKAPRRPLLRYHGGKWRLAPWIITHFPPHRIYVEPYSGAASVLLRKARSYCEVYNDLDGEIVNVFRIMRDPSTAAELKRLMELTPFARAEFNLSYEKTDDPVEWARRTVVRSFYGFSSDSPTRDHKTGFRTTNFNSGRHACLDWRSNADNLDSICKRLQGVVIEEMPALEIIAKYDQPDTLFYLDPPYVSTTRCKRCNENVYRHEMTDNDHRDLAIALHGIRGMAFLSGFTSALYDELYRDWIMVSIEAIGQSGAGKGSKHTTECLWISPRAQEAKLPLFQGII